MGKQRMVSIVMTYYERKAQLEQTLNSFMEKAYDNYEVIIVDDASPSQAIDTECLKRKFPDIPLKIVSITAEQKDYLNPSVPFNIGFREVSGDFVIIQNAECLHLDDILSHVRSNLNDGNYLTYGCFSLNEKDSRRLWDGDVTIDGLSQSIKDRPATSDGDSGWYNHSFYRPEAFHFTAAITRSNLEDLGGFDERFASGIGYDDNELLYRVRRKGLKVDIIDDRISIHQWHYSFPKNPRFDFFFIRNQMVFKWITKKESYQGEKSLIYRLLDRFFPVIYLLRKLQRLKRVVGRIIRFRSDFRIHSWDTLRYYRLKKSKLLSGRKGLSDSGRVRFRGKDTPIFINSFNRLYYLRKMISRLEHDGYENIIILDNKSIYPPLQEFLRETNHRVIRLRRNRGYLAIWYSRECVDLLEDYYVYTDPDILPEEGCPSDYLEHFFSLLECYPDIDKVGFSLDIHSADIKKEFEPYIRNHEEQHWRQRRDEESFDAPIDTTFALYRPRIGGGFWLKALRTDRPYIARHLPWHVDDDKELAEENEFYARQIRRSTHWSASLFNREKKASG